MYTICFVNPNGDKIFEDTMDIATWQTNNPYATIHHIFNINGDIQNQQTNMESNFLTHSKEYGIPATCLHTTFLNVNGHECEILGLKPNNRKYKFIIKNLSLGKRFKVTPDYIKTGLAKVKP